MTKTNLNAKHYQANSELQNRLAKEVLAFHTIQANDFILDIGCADGSLTAEIAAMTPNGHVLGIDVSKEMIKLAKNTHLLNHNNISFKVQAAENFCQANTYHLITAFSCLHWVKDIGKVFKNAYSSLKHGGQLLALTYPLESKYWQIFIKTMQHPKWQQYLNHSIIPNWKTSDELLTLAMANDFKINKWELEESVAKYPCDKSFMDYVTGWLPCLFSASLTIQKQFLKDALLIAHNEFNGLSIPYTKLQFCLQK